MGNARVFIIVAVIGLVALLAIGIVPRLINRGDLKKMEEETAGAVPIVHTVVAQPAAYEESGVMPGNIGAIQYASIFARVDGYLKSRLVDIGDHVKAGQLLAEIDTPTVDQELEQDKGALAEAKGQLSTAEANYKEAQAKRVASQAQVQKAVSDQAYTAMTANRWSNMAAKGAVSVQSKDEKVTADKAQIAEVEAAQAQEKAAEQAVNAAKAQIASARALVDAKAAAVQRTLAKQSFKYVRAPFDGIITLRKVDPGALITAGSQSSSLELFQMGQIDHLRIYINAPQSVARYLQKGLAAEVMVPEFPGRAFEGIVSNVSGALDPQTRTRQTEVRLENPQHILLPGMYAQVKLTAVRTEPWIRVPGTALVPRNNTTAVAVVENGKVHFKPVTIGRDFGDSVEVSFGLKPGDTVVVSPPVDLVDGEAVKPQPIAESK